MTEAEWANLDSVLAKLSDQDLGAWDQDFVDDMIKRLAKYGTSVTVSARQWEQLERLKDKHL